MEPPRSGECRFDGDRRPGAPRVWAIDTPRATAACPEAQRQHARRLARIALCEQLAPQWGCAPRQLAVTDERGEPPRLRWLGPGAAPAALAGSGVSMAHASGVSLLAWHPNGAVGVDVQPLPTNAPAHELVRTARLYFEPNWPVAGAEQAQPATIFEAFATRWVAHEARLKCLGLPLLEWSPALAERLAPVPDAPLALPAWAPRDCAAAVAWPP